MEVGAIKHDLNNEIIHIKKKLNQAKVQLIHKLTRKASTLKSQTRASEHIKEKIKRKAETAVAEVLLLKKVKAKDLVRFAITHKGTLQEHLNTSAVNEEKVFAKILLHKTMTDKYKSMRQKFANMPADELLLTRRERLKLKKERNETSKKEKIYKNITNDNVVEKEQSKDEESLSDENNLPENDLNNCSDREDVEEVMSESNDSEEDPNDIEIDKPLEVKKEDKRKTVNALRNVKSSKKLKKNKNKKCSNDAVEIVEQTKVVDSFFMTTSGDHYMTLAEPRAPDEIKEEHNRGNRRMRRAEKFGKPMKTYGKWNDFRVETNSKYEKPAFSKNNREFCTGRGKSFDSKSVNEKPAKEEKLHPSWEAKKQKSGIVAFQGKKVVF